MMAMQKLDSYLEANGLTASAFAARLGVSEATISRLRKGKQSPSWDLIQRIAAETSGQIEPNDFLREVAS
jgi:transcriptional regulator with XRE-family HTH domain